LYIALKGTYANKIAYKKWDNPLAYPKKKLYINLLGAPEDISYEYEFEFLTESEATKMDDDHHWFPVGKILDLKELSDVMDYLITSGLAANSDKEKAQYANRTLSKLHAVILVNRIISYYLEQSTSWTRS
jgi:hypothetical protein